MTGIYLLLIVSHLQQAHAGGVIPLTSFPRLRVGLTSVPSEQMLRDAVASFHRSDFVKAADLFEELNRRGAHNPEHYRNQGNAELLAGRLPRAIFSYRRGLQLDPGDRELQANLRYARDQVRYENTLRPADTAWPTLLRPGTLFWSGVAFWSLTFLALTCWLITARFAWLAATAASCTLTILCAAGFGWWQWQSHVESAMPLAVIAQDKTPLRQGNGVSYPAHPQTPELGRGLEVRRLHRRGAWLQIQLPSGDIGWVQDAAVVTD